jgi:hypothetical protein
LIVSAEQVESGQREFVPIDYSSRNVHAAVTVAWPQADRVTVQVSLSGDGPASRLERTWNGRPPAADRVLDALSGLGRPAGNGSDEHVLRVRRAGGETAVAWSAAAETKELSQLREALDAATHISYAEATAHFERGKALAAGGDHAGGLKVLRIGVDVLGERFRAPQQRDDTGTRLTFARHKEKDGDLKAAYTLTERALESRLSEYRRVQLSGPQVESPAR